MKKGFTLIELLAVIVILAIIAVIAVPIVINIIDETKVNANKRSIDMYAKSVESAIARHQLKEGKTTVNPNDIKKYIDYKGSKVECDTFIINKNGSYYLNNCRVNNVLVKNYSKGKIELADFISSNYGGSSSIKEIDALKYENVIIANSKQINLSGKNFYYGTSYTTTSGLSYKLDGEIVQATLDECRAGKKSDGTAINCKYTLAKTTATETFQYLIEIIDWKTSGNYVTATNYVLQKPFANNKPITNLYKTQDDLGDSYYFRGEPTNNYVQFGTYANDDIKYQNTYNFKPYDTLGECQAAKGVDYPPDEYYGDGNGVECNEAVYAREGSPMYWQIVRINGDGTIRLIYNGTSKGKSSVSNIGDSQYNSSFEGYQYVGYTYDDGSGNQVNSTIKGVIDTWYNTHLKDKYGKYIADGIFCNDRSGDGYGYYNASSRTTNPTLKCLNKSDRYSLNENIGNALLTNPIGLLSYDEYVFAGGLNGGYINSSYWTSTPYESSQMKIAGTTDGMSTGNDYLTVNESFDVRPVINLKADVEFTGSGTKTDPYVIVTE